MTSLDTGCTPDDPIVGIDAPYTPDDHLGETGWLWLEGEGDFPGESGWVLVVTWLPDGKDAEPQLRIVRPDCEDEAYPADDFAGLPYIPCNTPKCAPGALLLIQLWVGAGASASVTFESGSDAEHVKDVRRCVMRELTR